MLTNEQSGYILRDLSDQSIHADTLYILTSSEHVAELQKRAYEDWEANPVEVFTGKKAQDFLQTGAHWSPVVLLVYGDVVVAACRANV